LHKDVWGSKCIASHITKLDVAIDRAEWPWRCDRFI